MVVKHAASINLTNVSYSLELCDFFLRVHTYAAIPGLQGDMGWVSLSVDRSVSMARFWNCLIQTNRLTKKTFLCDYQLYKNNWSSQIKIIFQSSHNIVNFQEKIEY